MDLDYRLVMHNYVLAYLVTLTYLFSLAYLIYNFLTFLILYSISTLSATLTRIPLFSCYVVIYNFVSLDIGN